MADVHLGKRRRVLASLMVVSMILSMAGCKKKSGSSKYEESPTLVKENDPYFNAETIELKMEPDPEKEVDYAFVEKVRFIGSLIQYNYYVSYKRPKDAGYDYGAYQTNRQVIYDLSGNKIIDLDSSQNETQISMTADKEGNLYQLAAHLDSSLAYHIELDKMENGEWVKMFALPELDQAMTYDGELQALDNGSFMISMSGAMSIFNGEGKKLCTVSDLGRSITSRVFTVGGKNYVLTRNNTLEGDADPQLKELDLATGKLGPGRDASKLTASGSIMTAEDGIYVSSYSKVLKYDLEKDSLDVLFDWNDTDIDMGPMNNAFFLSKGENELYAVYSDLMELSRSNAKLIHLTRAEKNPHAGKKLITVGGRSLDRAFQRFVSAYNSDPSQKCRIIQRSYYEELCIQGKDPDEQNYEDYVRQDIKSGTAPDIILNFDTCTSLFNEDIMVDLKPFIDGDNGLDRSLIYDNVLSAFEKNGKQYFVPLSFSIQTLLANDEYIPKDADWTYKGYLACGSSLPENVSFCETIPKSQILTMLYHTSAGQFVDYEKQQVSFDQEDFYTMLEIANTYGVDKIEEDRNKQVRYADDGTTIISYDIGEDPYYKEEEKFQEGLTAIIFEPIPSVREFGASVELLGTKGSFRGYPGKDGSGNYATAELSMGIPVCSKNRNSAWEVIRALFDEEAQLTLSQYYGIPMSKSAYRKDAKKDMDSLREEWNNYQDDPLILQGMHLPEANDEYIDELEQQILAVNRVNEMDTAINHIMLEEAEAYFAGDRTKEDVAKIINNRASTAVKER